VDEAKAQLPDLTAATPAPSPTRTRKPRTNGSGWFSWVHPAFAAPVFAVLLLVVGYQNLVTFPALRAKANRPSILASAPLGGPTRGGDHLTITADRMHGVALPFDLDRQPDTASYASYSFALYDPQGKLAWTGDVALPADNQSGDRRISLAIPGAMLQNGAYTVAVSGIGPHGERTEIERRVFDLRLTD